MIKEARVGGGEISLTIDNDGNTTYTGKLYGIPGWDEKEESSYSSKISSNKLITLLKEKNSINNTCDFHYTNNLNNNNNTLNQLIMGSQLLRTAYQKK
ncbi:hypothetical protein psyc5s11_43450 [Clostridium gelidum]|uniref:Uncharacterized protein n=1 Tax=Clostridium gelidum TaxID=704125 RepID=A0ABM7TB09_9CLOT|nr:hypothetical protein [Clostridium gelidum]BCZ48278.1 hypothetical protein psyc5s11_43450 [Clostridium gelidum]